MQQTGMNGVTLVLGGARSGKSRLAEARITALDGPWVYVATGQAYDDEMRERISHHRERRDPRWETVEEPVQVSRVLKEAGGRPVLVDCLTLWLTNLLMQERDIQQDVKEFLEALRLREGPTVLVGNEVGLGIVPQNALARRFRDEAGFLHQRIAAEAGEVVFVAAGLPLTLKSPSMKSASL